MKTFSVTAAVLALLMTGATSFAIPAKGAVKKQCADGTPNVYKIGVTGFVWKVGCTPRVRAALTSIKGVDKVVVDPTTKSATVTMKAGKSLDQKTAAAALATKGEYGVGKFGAMAASTFVVGIEGMTCEVCAGKVSKSLAGVKGVGNIEVDVEKKNATITTKPGAMLAKADATKAVKAAGYKLTSFEKQAKQLPGAAKTSSGQYVLSVSGMTWSRGCVKRVSSALTRLKGVDSVQVNFAAKTATVKMKDGAKLTQAEAQKALGRFGVTKFTSK